MTEHWLCYLIDCPQPVLPPPPLPVVVVVPWYPEIQEFARVVFNIEIIKQALVVLCFIAVLLLLIYAVFDKLVNMCKFILLWGFWGFGVINFLRIERVKLACAWLINKLI